MLISHQRARRHQPKRSLVACRELRRHSGGFTLIELSVVLVIIAMLAAVSLPALKNIRQSNAMVSAGRQLVEHLGYARARAISDNTTVYVVFIPPDLVNQTFTLSPKENKLAERLKGGLFTTYAIFAERAVGEQPGRGTARYLMDWKSLPAGVLIETNKFLGVANPPDLAKRAFPNNKSFYFPTATNQAVTYNLPYIGFDNRGRLVPPDPAKPDSGLGGEVIPLARGSILYVRDAAGKLDLTSLDVRENVPDDMGRHHIVIDGLTGRARVETQAPY